MEYLKENGMVILEHNYRVRFGEIDLICQDGEYLVFVEVKYRSSTAMGTALSAVNYKKQRQICKVADYYRMSHHLGENTNIRYDVLAIQQEDIIWLKNAFLHIYS